MFHETECYFCRTILKLRNLIKVCSINTSEKLFIQNFSLLNLYFTENLKNEKKVKLDLIMRSPVRAKIY